MRIALTPLSRTTIRLCEEIDEVRYEPTVDAIAVGVLNAKHVLVVGRAYAEIPVYGADDPRRNDADYLREQFLLHEAWHVLLGHDRRRGPRKRWEWNLACDAVIHHRATIDLQAIESTGVTPVTFERLQMEPCRPEIAYEQLVRAADTGESDESSDRDRCLQSGGCGRPDDEEFRRLCASDGSADDLDESLADALQASLAGAVMEGVCEDEAAHGLNTTKMKTARWTPTPSKGWSPRGNCGAGGDGSTGRSRPRDVENVAPWVDDVLQALRLVPVNGGDRRNRSYRREHRSGHPLLPGRSRTDGVLRPVFFLDGSGSVSDRLVEEMLAALRLTAEFSDAVAYVFDDKIRGPFLASDIEAVREALAESGGGTRIAGGWREVADQIDLSATRVWVTDAVDGYSEALPRPWTDDIWVVGGEWWGRHDMEVIARDALDRGLAELWKGYDDDE